LDLTYCKLLEELAENVGQSAPKLKRLVLFGCSSLRRLPESIGHLTDLEHLDLNECRKLVALPYAICGLVSLRTLVLSFCEKLQQLPEEFGKLTNLETLEVTRCSTLSDLPASIGGLRMLKTLVMRCTKVRDLPEEFGLLTSLTSLELPELRSVPQTFQGLQSLTSLRLDGGSADVGDLGALTALKHLNFWAHATITTLPKCMGNLKWLVRLEMRFCRKLMTVEALPEGLEHLDLRYCSNLAEIPSLATMRYLLRLDFLGCRSLRHAHGLECLTTLEDIDISGCISIEGHRINGMESNALRECDVRISRVSVTYNNRWLEVRISSSILDVRVVTW
jgi:Leucine-rich repeat (LRR) protein